MACETLEKNAEIIMGQSPTGETCNDKGDGLPLLNGPTEFGPHHPTPVQFTTNPRKRAEKGDILFCVRGSTTGKMNWADREYAIGRGIAAIRPHKGMEYSPFLKAVIENRLPELLIQATGSTFPNVSYSQLAEMSFPSLDDSDQLEIARILGTLDDKIELNRKMNETLEAMAQALFKSWFVDFDPIHAKAEGRDTGLPKEIADLFPSEFQKSELGEVPKRWEIKPFTDTMEIIGGGTPKTSVSEYWDGNIAWFSVADSPKGNDVWVIDTEKKITQAGVEASSTRLLEVGTTIITARGTVGKVALVGVPVTMNQSCYGLRGKNDRHGYFTYFLTRHLISELQMHAHGSVFDTITRETFAGLNVVVPSPSIIEAFNDKLHPILNRMLVGLKEAHTLTIQRDTLLPKLFSGEIRLGRVN